MFSALVLLCHFDHESDWLHGDFVGAVKSSYFPQNIGIKIATDQGSEGLRNWIKYSWVSRDGVGRWGSPVSTFLGGEATLVKEQTASQGWRGSKTLVMAGLSYSQGQSWSWLGRVAAQDVRLSFRLSSGGAGGAGTSGWLEERLDG